MDSLKNLTYDLMKLPNSKRTLKNKWVFILKQEDNSAKLRYKARLVVKDFNQKKRADFKEMFSLIIKNVINSSNAENSSQFGFRDRTFEC